ncbi:neuromedin-S isoform X1 [Gopherus flavomarginatus]|uniref:neuromedin-S isoform X1 n=1 Tax=Gopherus flavomarginatus TaxID=286002 RepID=UPI0021CC36B4|nr:neuromedin-S isoform X1 [Gopherus flavomarginatus]
MLRSWQNNQSLSPAGRNRWLKMKQHPFPFPLIFALYCFCTLQFSSGFPQPVAGSIDAPDVPKSELALCFSQWTELSNQPQISNKVMDLCNAIFNSMQIEEENNENIYKRESQIAAAEFTKKDSAGTMGRPFFLFRPRNGRTIEDGGE